MPKDLNMCILLDIYGSIITEKQFEVMDYYYNQDYSLQEISEHLKITRQGVRDNIKRAEHAILNCEGKLGLYEKYVYNKEKLSRVEELLLNINNLNNVQLKNASLQGWLNEVSKIIDELII